MLCPDPKLDRDFLVRLWVDERKLIASTEKILSKSREKRRQKVVNYANHGETGYVNQSSFQNPLERWFSASSATEEKSYDETKQVLKQPPLSQPITGALKPSFPEEARIAPLLARSNLLINKGYRMGKSYVWF